MIKNKIIATFMLVVYYMALNPMLGYGNEPVVKKISFPADVWSASGIITAQAGGEVNFDGARILVPAGAVKNDIEITITRLPVTEDTGESMVNVLPLGGAYRFEPAGTKFLKDVVIELPYDPKLNGNQASLDELKTYFFDVKEQRWVALERLGYDAERGVVESITTHFTDMINGTLTVPESVDPIDVNLNSIKNLEAANANTAVPQLEGLEGGSDGSASFMMKVDIPNGRKGMMPNVAIRYNSGGGLGISGKGFDIQYGSQISIDTRFGAAKYDHTATEDGTDIYNLDGVILEQTGGSEYGRLLYQEQRITTYRTITHVKNGNYWEIKESDGRIKIYGKTGNSWSGRNSYDKNIWYLEKETDVYGNTITYTYIKDANYVYPQKINYTGYGETPGPYQVIFNYENTRDDVRIDARGGYAQKLQKRLSEINVCSIGNKSLRKYRFEYTNGLAKESFVNALVGVDANDTEWWRYDFEYTEYSKNSSGNIQFFSAPVHYGNAPLSVTKNVSNGNQYSGGAGVGIGSASGSWDVRGTIGKQHSSSKGKTYSEYILIDINGDGRTDVVKQSGSHLYVQLNTGEGFSDQTSVEVTGLNSIDIQRENSKTNSTGTNRYVGLTFFNPLLSAGKGPSQSKQRGSGELTSSFMDVDGDGLVDIAISNEKYYYRNVSKEDGVVKFEKVDISINSSPVFETVLTDDERDEYHQSYFVQRPFRMWKAPYEGTIQIDQSVTKKEGDGTVDTSVYQSDNPVDGAGITINTSGKVEKSTSVDVDLLQRLYYIHNITPKDDISKDIRDNDIEWNIKVRYTEINPYLNDFDLIEFVPAATINSYPNVPIDATLSILYENIHQQYTYTLKDNWATLLRGESDEAKAARQTLYTSNRYFPKLIKGTVFDGIFNSLSESQQDTLGAYFVYDAARKEYRKSSVAKIEITTLQKIYTILKDKATISDYSLHNGVLPVINDEGQLTYQRKQEYGVYGDRNRSKEGCVCSLGNYIYLGIVNGKKAHISNNLFYLDNTESGYLVDKQINDYDETKIIVTKSENGSAEADLFWTFTGGDEIAKSIDVDEMDTIWKDGRFTSSFIAPNTRNLYTLQNPYWGAASVESFNNFFSVYTSKNLLTATDIANFRSKYFIYIENKDKEGNVISSYYSPNPATLTEGNSLLKQYERLYFNNFILPYYYILSEGCYKINSNVLANLPEKQEDRNKDDIYLLLTGITNQFYLYNYSTVKKGIRYYSDHRYAVNNNTYTSTIFDVSDRSFTTMETEVEDWDSGRDYSSKDVTVINPVYRKITEQEDGETVETEVLVLNSDDMLYGGNKGWFYGVWVGGEDTDPFSVTKFNSNLDIAKKKADRVTEQPTKDDEYQEDDDRDIGQHFYLVRNSEAIKEAYTDDFPFEDTETAVPVDSTILSGDISVVSNQELVWDGDDRLLKVIDHFFFPYISKDTIHINRNGGSVYYDIPGIGTSSEGFGVGLLRKTLNYGEDESSTIGFSIASGSKSSNDGWSKMVQNVQDMNGDGIADLVLTDNTQGIIVQYGTRSSNGDVVFGDKKVFDSTIHELSYSENSNDGEGMGFNAGPSIVPLKKSVHIPGSPSFGTSDSTSEGANLQQKGMMDINGDGLADYIDNGEVSLSTGFTYLSQAEGSIDGLPAYLSTGKMICKSDSMSMGLSAKSGLDGIPRTTLIITAGLSAGRNKSSSLSQSTQLVMDINGDGLPDIVKKDESNSNKLIVQLNTGTNFADPIELLVPDWGSDILTLLSANLPNKTDGNINSTVLKNASIIGKLYKSEYANYSSHYGNDLDSNTNSWANELDCTSSVTRGMNGGINIGGNVHIVISLLFFSFGINISCTGSNGSNASSGVTSASVKMMDINGDGLPDQVLRVPGGKTYAKLHQGAKVGLMKTIHLPQGGSYQLEYGSAGNTFNMPQYRNVLKKITYIDNLENEEVGCSKYVQQFSYKDGNYDRLKKEFYGFYEVTSWYGEGSCNSDGLGYTKTFYYNDAYYRKGMIKETSTFNENGDEIQKQVLIVDDAPYARTTNQKTVVYDGSNRSQYIESSQDFDYDLYGNVCDFYDNGDLANESDTIHASFQYVMETGSHIYNKPKSITVKDSDNRMLRFRKGIYSNDGKASLLALNQYYTDNEYLEHSFDYDNFGNITNITDSAGVQLRYTYDTNYNQYVKEIEQTGRGNSDSYVSTIDWDFTWGHKTYETDPNGQTMHYTYDEKGRLTEVWTPYDTGSTPAVRYRYTTEPGSRWYAVTENKVTFDGNDSTNVMLTVLELDGLGRARRTAKAGEVFDTNSMTSRKGWNISGTIKYDGKRRAIEEGQNYFVTANVGESGIQTLLTSGLQFDRVTKKVYDGLDRIVRTELPGSGAQYEVVETRIKYGVTNLDGEYLSYTKTTDPLKNISIQYQNARGNIVRIERRDNTSSEKILTNATYDYNGLGEMLTARDAVDNPVTVTYDMLGRKLSMVSIDTGSEMYQYNKYGQLWRVSNPMLRSKGQFITYEYDSFGRMVKLDYPESGDITYVYGDSAATSMNQAGRLISVSDDNVSTEYEYGLLGETIGETRSIVQRSDSLNTARTAEMRYRSDYLGRMQQITYPDGEVIQYAYNYGGEVESVTGTRNGKNFTYVEKIGYDEWSQRVYLKLGNGVETKYEYDENRRWLDKIHTSSGYTVLQNISYSFDDVGNVGGYSNTAGSYSTSQDYEYDGLYQLIGAAGTTEQMRFGQMEYTASYSQVFTFDSEGLGRMSHKTSSTTQSDSRNIGDDLDYDLDYDYEEGYVHRVKRIGSRYYKYDLNGNVILEQDTAIASDDSGITYTIQDLGNDTYVSDYGWGMETQEGAVIQTTSGFRRTYSWNERNLITTTSDNRYLVNYRYDHAGERVGKFAVQNNGGSASETLYFNKMWSWRYDGLQSERLGRNSKHIYLGATRILTKVARADGYETSEDSIKQYYYHNDHLGSAQLITNADGEEYERIEYTPYGELWVEKASAASNIDIPYRFTGKERDEETGLYYFGARYLDPKTSRWLSADPALGDYIPGAPVNDEAKKRNGNLPGMGGVFNLVNLHLYHYAGNNPVKYIDPDGNEILNASTTLFMSSAVNAKLGTSSARIADVGCVLTAYTRIASAIVGSDISLADANRYAVENNLFSGKQGNLLTPEAGAQLINGLISEAGIENVSVELYSSGGNLTGNAEHEMNMFNIMDSSDTEYFATGRINTTNADGTETYGHHVNLNHNAFTLDPQADNPINLRVNDTSGVRKQIFNDTRTNQLERIDYYKVIRNPVITEE